MFKEEMAGHYLLEEKSVKYEERDPRSSYITTIKTVEGDAEHVFLKVAELLKEDHWTPMYSHMRLRIANIEVSQFSIKVTLSKSYFAGD